MRIHFRFRHRISSASIAAGFGLALVSTCLSTGPAGAQTTLYDNKDGTTITGSFTGVTGFFGAGNVDFGAGDQNSFPAGNATPSNRKTERLWLEGSIMPGLGVQFPSPLGDKGNLYGNLSVVGSGTVGDGDAVSSLTPQSSRSTTSNDPFHLELETAAGGWRSGDTFKNSLGTDAIDISYGDQDFIVGDGLVIDTGTNTGWRRAAYYTSLQSAFQRSAIVRLAPDGVPMRANLFKLENRSNMDLMQGNDSPESKLAGFNAEFFQAGAPTKDAPNPPDVWTLGVMYFNIYESDSQSLTAANPTVGSAFATTPSGDRSGLNVYSFRAAGSFLRADPDILFHGEYVGEQNGESGRKVDADAWYIEPGYNLESLPWAPVISLRYAHFSGETNTNGTVKHSYDPLFYGAGPRGYGSWFLGEVYGWYLGPPSNVNVWQIGVQAAPTANTTLGMIFYDFAFATHQYAAGNPAITATHALDEVDVMGSWTPDRLNFLTLSSVVGVGIPGKAFDQAASSYAQANTGGGAAASTGAPMVVGELIATVKF